VDSGAEFTWIKAETLKQIGVKREKKDYTFVMANGQHITRAVGFAIIRVGDALTTDEVIFGEPGDLQILGARSLEGMNLRVDSRAKKLVAGGPILAVAQLVVRAAESWSVSEKYALSLVVKAVSPGEISLGDQFRLSRQPMLDLVARLRTLVHITEIGLSGHFVRRCHQIKRRRGIGRFLLLFLGIFIEFHKASVGLLSASFIA